jgi:hypothetical protein
MARRLNAGFGPARGRSRRAAWWALVLAVVGVHAWVGRSVLEAMAPGQGARSGPPRIEVAYVREMALGPPPPAAAPAAPTPPPARAVPAPRPRLTAPSGPASAPGPEPPRPAAPAPGEGGASAPRETAAAAEPEPAAASMAGPASPAASAAAPFEWPVSTRVSYVLTGNYRGAVQGSAEVEWVRVGSHYQVHVDFVIGPRFAPLIRQRSSSDGEITPAGLAPRRYDQDARFLASERPHQTVLFDAGYVVLANGDVRTALPGLQDTASQFVQLTYLFSVRPDRLRVGGSVDVPLALPRQVGVWTYDVVAQDTLHTPFGALEGIHLRPRGPRVAGAIRVEMWFAPQLRNLPARLRFERDAQTYIDLLIARPPQTAE